MGIFLKTEILPDCHLGVWEITEDFDTLYEMVSLSKVEKAKVSSFRNENRKREWLSVRALIQSMAGKDAKIVYNADNKPFLRNSDYRISISHSRDLTAILIGKDIKVGIDLEYMSGNIDRIHEKFINEQERITGDPEMKKFHLYLHWCAKEALFKIIDKQDINFRTALTIKPFEPDDHGFLRGYVVNGSRTDDYELEYLHHENYALVWCCK